MVWYGMVRYGTVGQGRAKQGRARPGRLGYANSRTGYHRIGCLLIDIIG